MENVDPNIEEPKKPAKRKMKSVQPNDVQGNQIFFIPFDKE